MEPKRKTLVLNKRLMHLILNDYSKQILETKKKVKFHNSGTQSRDLVTYISQESHRMLDVDELVLQDALASVNTAAQASRDARQAQVREGCIFFFCSSF